MSVCPVYSTEEVFVVKLYQALTVGENQYEGKTSQYVNNGLPSNRLPYCQPAFTIHCPLWLLLLLLLVLCKMRSSCLNLATLVSTYRTQWGIMATSGTLGHLPVPRRAALLGHAGQKGAFVSRALRDWVLAGLAPARTSTALFRYFDNVFCGAGQWRPLFGGASLCCSGAGGDVQTFLGRRPPTQELPLSPSVDFCFFFLFCSDLFCLFDSHPIATKSSQSVGGSE